MNNTPNNRPNNTPDKRAASRKSCAVAALLCCASALGLPHDAIAQARKPVPGASPPRITTVKEIHMVAPALEHYTQDLLLGEVWKRPGLSPRDRSMVTVSALVASG
jgi:4-carboxymuconolactone decarboxylase